MEDCQLKSAIIIPLMEGDEVVGTLKLYKDKENAINKTETELALGLVIYFQLKLNLVK